MKRHIIQRKINNKIAFIDNLKNEILELRRQEVLISDKNQQFVEKEEQVLISGRPKVYETKLVGRIFWKEKFIDQDDPKHPIFIERTQVVRINGEWQ